MRFLFSQSSSSPSFANPCRKIERAALSLFLCLLLLCIVALGQQDLITDIRVHGNRRIPVDTVKARIFTKAGDVYDPAAVERDFNSLWNTGYYEDIRFEREQTPKGWILHIYVKERPNIREITYSGLSSVTTSDVLDRFKEAKVGLSQESQYDPTKDQESRSRPETVACQSTAGSSPPSGPRFAKFLPVRGLDVRRQGRTQGQSRQDPL